MNIKHYFLKQALRLFGHWSDGIRLAMTEGFTSGMMLDYVYKNKPGGKFFVGKLIDRIFLRHEGWRAVRERKDQLCAHLEKAVDLTLEAKGRARLCDVAAGPALYMAEVLEKYRDQDVSAEIRDLDSRWLEEAQKRADEKGLKLTHRVANALEKSDFVFDDPTLTQPDIFVASGFYDWFNDAEMIKTSMRLIYDALPAGGFFVFTNQSGHFGLEMTNYLFQDFNHKPLEMVTWDAELVNSWVKEIGFEILDVRKSTKGYYSNVLAVKK